MAFNYFTNQGDDYVSDDVFDDYGSNRCATIYLIDATKSMFESHNGNILESPFSYALKCVHHAMRQAVVTSDSDLMGILLFGTKKTKHYMYQPETTNLEHLYLFQEVEQPSSERIRALIELTEEEELLNLREEIGHSDEFRIGDALWLCSDILSKIKIKQLLKRIMIFTCNDDPHPNDPILKLAAYSRADDLMKVGYDISPVPLFSGVSRSFSSEKFYGNLERHAYDNDSRSSVEYGDAKFLNDAAQRFEKLCEIVLAKNHKKRSVGQLYLSLGPGNDKRLAVKAYNLVRKMAKPPATTVTRQHGEIVRRTTTMYYDDVAGDVEVEGEAGDLKVVMPQDIAMFQEYGGKRAVVEQHELQDLKSFGPSGIQIIGFKPLSSLKMHCLFTRHGHFLYPDDSAVEGSIKLFSALLDRCLARNVYALCRFIARKRTPPRLVALIPLAEETNADGAQTVPPGFHLAYLPFADDIRGISHIDNPEVSPVFADSDQVNVAKKAVLALTEDYKSKRSPVLQTHWSVIEAAALGLPLEDNFVDQTLPKPEVLTKAKAAICDFDKCIPDATESRGTKRSAKAELDDGNLVVEVEKCASSGKLGGLTVNILKQFLETVGCSFASNTKKAQLIEMVERHFKTASQRKAKATKT